MKLHMNMINAYCYGIRLYAIMPNEIMPNGDLFCRALFREKFNEFSQIIPILFHSSLPSPTRGSPLLRIAFPSTGLLPMDSMKTSRWPAPLSRVDVFSGLRSKLMIWRSIKRHSRVTKAVVSYKKNYIGTLWFNHQYDLIRMFNEKYVISHKYI